MRLTFFLLALFALVLSITCTTATPLQDTTVYPMGIVHRLRQSAAADPEPEAMALSVTKPLTTPRESFRCRKLRLLGMRVRACAGEMVVRITTVRKIQYTDDFLGYRTLTFKLILSTENLKIYPSRSIHISQSLHNCAICNLLYLIHSTTIVKM